MVTSEQCSREEGHSLESGPQGQKFAPSSLHPEVTQGCRQPSGSSGHDYWSRQTARSLPSPRMYQVIDELQVATRGDRDVGHCLQYYVHILMRHVKLTSM